MDPSVPPSHELDPIHIGWAALACSPMKAASARYGMNYANPTVFSKLRLLAMLQAEYQTVAALNSAWGSNYTTFGSAGGWPKSSTGGRGLMDEDGATMPSGAGTSNPGPMPWTKSPSSGDIPMTQGEVSHWLQ
jgi:hypothetical protein